MYVYFLQMGDDGPIKIGWTGRNMAKRLREHCCDKPYLKIKFLGKLKGTKNREAAIHKLFNKDMVLPEYLHEGVGDIKKTELFRPSKSLLGYINRLQDKSLS